MFSEPDVPDLEEREEFSPFTSIQNPEGDLYLRFFNDMKEEFALPAMGIREVLSIDSAQITPIPNVSPILMGVLNFRGQVIWVTDIGQFLGSSKFLNVDRSELSIIVIESQDVMVGLAVESVKGMEWLNMDVISPISDVSDSMSPFLKGEWQGLTDKPIRLLEPTAILRSARWAA